MKNWEELTGEEKSLVEKRWNEVKNNSDEHTFEPKRAVLSTDAKSYYENARYVVSILGLDIAREWDLTPLTKRKKVYTTKDGVKRLLTEAVMTKPWFRNEFHITVGKGMRRIGLMHTESKKEADSFFDKIFRGMWADSEYPDNYIVEIEIDAS